MRHMTLRGWVPKRTGSVHGPIKMSDKKVEFLVKIENQIPSCTFNRLFNLKLLKTQGILFKCTFKISFWLTKVSVFATNQLDTEDNLLFTFVAEKDRKTCFNAKKIDFDQQMA